MYVRKRALPLWYRSASKADATHVETQPRTHSCKHQASRWPLWRLWHQQVTGGEGCLAAVGRDPVQAPAAFQYIPGPRYRYCATGARGVYVEHVQPLPISIPPRDAQLTARRAAVAAPVVTSFILLQVGGEASSGF